MILLNLNRRRRGQIRAVDFIVSLLLFLLMLSQLLLIIINVQSGLTTQMRNELTYSELDTLGRIILQEQGQDFWGYQNSLPDSFGLASATNIPSFSLDAAKVARIVTGTSFPISDISGFEQFTYSSVKTILGLDSELDFQLAFLSYFEPILQITETTTEDEFNATVTVKNLNQKVIENCQVNFFILNLASGNIHLEQNKISDTNGQTSMTYLDPEGEKIVIILAEKGSLWGVTWKHHLPTHENILLGRESKATVWASEIDPSTLLFSDTHDRGLESPEDHYLSYIYKDSQTSFANETIDLKSTLKGNFTVPIPKDGLVVYFSVMKTGGIYKVGIGTYPTVLDSNLSSGKFYPIFGSTADSSREKSRIAKDYPVYIRGLLMKCRIILWST